MTERLACFIENMLSTFEKQPWVTFIVVVLNRPTIRNEDANKHGAKNDAQSDALEAKGWHIPSCGKSAIFLLKKRRRDKPFI